MNRIVFAVQGSDVLPYSVEFERDGAHLFASCTCQAGRTGAMCKHRLRILSGSGEDVSVGAEHISTVTAWLVGSPLELALSELAQAEAEQEVSKKAVSRAKAKVAAAARR
jgi:uncharacterized Zn finger protein